MLNIDDDEDEMRYTCLCEVDTLKERHVAIHDELQIMFVIGSHCCGRCKEKYCYMCNTFKLGVRADKGGKVRGVCRECKPKVRGIIADYELEQRRIRWKKEEEARVAKWKEEEAKRKAEEEAKRKEEERERKRKHLEAMKKEFRHVIRCGDCGDLFGSDYSWKKLCLPCYIQRKKPKHPKKPAMMFIRET